MKFITNMTCIFILFSGTLIHNVSKTQTNKLNSGIIKYETTRVAKIGAAGQQFTQKLNINTTYHFLRNKARYDAVMMGNIKISVFLKTQDKDHYQTLDLKGMQYAVAIPSQGEVIKVLDETKDILGYSCKKALVKYNDKEATVYFTTLIPYDHSPEGNFDLGGAILAFESEDINVIATSIESTSVSGKDVTLAGNRKKISLEEKKALLAGE